jgi:hypothetical protein
MQWGGSVDFWRVRQYFILVAFDNENGRLKSSKKLIQKALEFHIKPAK